MGLPRAELGATRKCVAERKEMGAICSSRLTQHPHNHRTSPPGNTGASRAHNGEKSCGEKACSGPPRLGALKGPKPTQKMHGIPSGRALAWTNFRDQHTLAGRTEPPPGAREPLTGKGPGGVHVYPHHYNHRPMVLPGTQPGRSFRLCPSKWALWGNTCAQHQGRDPPAAGTIT